jgi:putative transposase
MFQDEAGFGRISDPAACWAPPKKRPNVPCLKIREYKSVYGAVSPLDGESFFMVLDKNDTENMNIFLENLSLEFTDILILLCLDRATYHKSADLKVPHNITLFLLPPRTPEMNPVEIVWREIRKTGFKNKCFDSLKAVVIKLHEVLASLTNEMFISITFWDWISDIVAC